MSNDNEKPELITNEDTLVRRAWIDSAVDSVRAKLGGTPGADDAQDRDDQVSPSEARCSAKPRSGRPKLYVAWSAEARRSGT